MLFSLVTAVDCTKQSQDFALAMYLTALFAEEPFSFKIWTTDV